MEYRTMITSLIERVSRDAQREGFEYREWFLEYHLRIVEDIAMKLAAAYPQVDADLVRVLAWTHDFSKPLTANKEEEKAQLIPLVRQALTEIGFESTFICARKSVTS